MGINKKYEIRTSLFVLLAVGILGFVNAQILPPWPVPGSIYRDVWSQGAYKDMKEDYRKMSVENAASAAIVANMEMAMREKALSMHINFSPLRNVRWAVEGFIRIDSNRFIFSKYPINPFSTLYSGQSMFKNAAIQLRFKLKFKDEQSNVNDYLGARRPGAADYLYITEGERMMLTLEALEKVINLALENETY